jgi:mono/diheme cytochrome c family protein
MRFAWNTVLAIFFIVIPTQAQAQVHALNKPEAFFAKFCLDCHDASAKEGGLSLVGLSAKYSDPELHKTWVRIFDRIRAGEMPPKDELQPTAKQREVLLAELEQKLHEASLQQQKDGRVTIRRLSRAEYENTIRDLLDIPVEVQSRLPEDNLIDGFDNISQGLETSATHLVRYQEAADLALVHAMPPRLSGLTIKRMTGKEWLEWRPKIYHKGIVPWSRIEGDSFVFRAQLYKHGSVHTDRTKVAGRYRFRASVRAINNQGKPIPVDIGRISTDRFGHAELEHLLGIQDAVEGESRIIEAEAHLITGESVYVSPRTLTLFRSWPKDVPKPDDPKFDGPELVVDWIELEGPLGLGDAFESFFGGMKRVPDRFVEDAKAGKKLQDWSRWNVNEFQKPHNRLRFITETPKEDAARLLGQFLPQAMRRPPTQDQLDFYIGRANTLLDSGMPLDEVLIKVYKEVLCSMQFLFRIEKPGKLDDFALASRLSYFLWNSMPDDELLELAARGELRKPEVLRTQAERLLKHRKGQRFVTHFTDHWLNLAETLDMKPDNLYREFDEELAWSMTEETRRFFVEVLDNNLPVTDFVHSDWSMLNERLGLHYDIDGIQGMNMRRVKLPADAHRGGVITQASILKLTTNATYTSPIKRGAWILERILGTPPAPPPPNVEAIEPDIRGAVTIREQMALHKTQQVCASCHRKIDPPGFALENYDILGGWRERYRVSKGGEGIDYVPLANHPNRKKESWKTSPQRVYLAKPVEAFGETSAGEAFADIDEYKKILLRDPNQIARNLAEKLLVYSTGSPIEFADRRSVEKIVKAAREDNYGFRTLLHAVIQSPVFQSK